MEFSCFFCDLPHIGRLICGSSAFAKSSLCIWNFSVHVVVFSNLIYVGLCMVFFMFFLNFGFSFSSDLENVWLLLFHTCFLHPFSPSLLQGLQGHTCWTAWCPRTGPASLLPFHILLSGLHVEFFPFLSSRSLTFPSAVSDLLLTPSSVFFVFCFFFKIKIYVFYL